MDLYSDFRRYEFGPKLKFKISFNFLSERKYLCSSTCSTGGIAAATGTPVLLFSGHSFFIEHVFVKRLLCVVLLECDDGREECCPSSRSPVAGMVFNRLLAKII